MDSAPPAMTICARAGANALIGHGDGLKAGGAEAVDGGAGNFDGKTGAQCGHARDVPALFALRLSATENDVLDLGFIEAGTLSKAPLNAIAARSSGRVVESAPLGARPTGVRTAATRTASGMSGSCGALVGDQWLAGQNKAATCWLIVRWRGRQRSSRSGTNSDAMLVLSIRSVQVPCE